MGLAGLLGASALTSAIATPAFAADAKKPDAPEGAVARAFLTSPQKVLSDGSVTVGGHAVAYQAEAGTLIVHQKGWDDSAGAVSTDEEDAKKNPDAIASMFYTAYFRKGAPVAGRPITFVYNGGPGSATVWLHMGAFGPKRVVTANDSHTPAGPYQMVSNDASLLDATDLVFIDAPGTGFGRVMGKEHDKAFYGTDPDAQAFADFIAQFLARHGRYNSPKYLFGESYGTTRSAILADLLAEQKGIDLNGVILLSQILNYDNSIDFAQINPSVDQPYVLALPSYAATAWYHDRLSSKPASLPDFVKEVEHFALTDYTEALQEGNLISDAKRDQIAQKLHEYIGLPVDYIKKADLRVNGGEFAKTLLGKENEDTGRLDSRFSGPSIDPLSQSPDYDPMDASIQAAYVAAFNDYTRSALHYGGNPAFGDGFQEYKLFAHSIRHWDFTHAQPQSGRGNHGWPNVLPDLAEAMKLNPGLKVMLNQGYFDLGTPFFEGIYEMQHLPIPHKLAKNIEIKQYMSGHMVYVNVDALHQLHDNVAAFIDRTHGHSGDVR